MVVENERKPSVGKMDRQKRLTRGNSHYQVFCSNVQQSNSIQKSPEHRPISSNNCSPAYRDYDYYNNNRNPPQIAVPVRSFIVPERIHHKEGIKPLHASMVRVSTCLESEGDLKTVWAALFNAQIKVEFVNINTPSISHPLKMSVQESLQYLDDTIAELDKARCPDSNQLYESESDLLSEFGYASGYTELSVTSDSENRLSKPTGASSKRRKSRQNRNQRYQSDPILGDLESDSTNDGCLFVANGPTPKTKTKTNSGQRRQRERRRQRRQTANRNSWTDSGLSLSKTDSQRSSHGENSPFKRGRSKTSPADVELDAENEATRKTTAHELAGDKKVSPVHMDSSISSRDMGIGRSAGEGDSMSAGNATQQSDEMQVSVDVSIESVSRETTESVKNPSINTSFDPSINSSLDQSLINIKPTNANGVVNGTYSPKEKEILQQVFQNARQSSNNMNQVEPSVKREALVSPSSRFPLPPHLDYPFCMYRSDAKQKKDKKSGGIMRGFRRLKEGISNRRKTHTSSRNDANLKNPRDFHHQTPLPAGMPPSKSVDKKKNGSLLTRIFKSQESSRGAEKSKSRSSVAKTSQNFRRDGRFGSSRSFTESIGQLWSRGSRARSQSMENLKKVFRGRDRAVPQFIKRTQSSTSLAPKLPRSISLSSLIGRRNKQFGSMVSVPAACSRQQNINSGFRRADSVRSLQGGYDIATRLLQSQMSCRDSMAFDSQSRYYDDANDNFVAPFGAPAEMMGPFRAGWRPASRISRRDPHIYEQQYYEDDCDYDAYEQYYEDEGPCMCGCNEQYTDQSCHYEDDERFIAQSPRNNTRQDCYGSRNTINHEYAYQPSHHFQQPPSRRSFSRQSNQPMLSSTYAPPPQQSVTPSYYSPRSYRAENRMVVAPLDVRVTHERKAERRQLSRANEVFDTMV
eukprot:gene4745-5369_t